MTPKAVEELFRKRRAEISSKACKNCVEHVKRVEKSYWKTDRVIDAKLEKLQIPFDAEDNKDDNNGEYSDSVEEEKDEWTVYSGCFPIYFIFLF